MDWEDFFTKDLERHRNAQPSPWPQRWTTASTRERIDRLSSDDYEPNRPAYRGQAPAHDEIEPPIMPSEHWLEDEPPPMTPAGKPSMDEVIESRVRMLCATHSHRRCRSFSAEDGSQKLIVPDDYLQADAYTL